MILRGMTKVLANMNLSVMAVSGDMERIAMNAGRLIERRAKENISGENGHTRHIKTGNLRRNIKSKVGWASTFELVGIIGTDVDYAPYIEALPDGGFLYPALVEVGDQVVSMVRDDIGKVIKGGFR